MGAYGFKIDWADPVVSLSFTFENNPLEFLLAQNTSATIAAAGFMAAVAIPNFLAYRTRAYDAEANADIKNAYLAAQAYFTDHPGGTVTLEDLMRIGYRRSEGVALTIENGAEDTLKMSSHHEKGKTVYFIDSMGNIEEISR
jgi:type IV pilus assembly protein PilA